MEPRLPERLVGVQVAHPGQKGLIEQQRLQACLAPAELRREDALVQVDERVGTETLGQEIVQLIARAEQVHAPKLPGIHKAQLAAIIELHAKVRVWLQRSRGVLQQKVAAHLAMHRQPLVVVEANQQVLATPIHLGHATPDERRAKLLFGGIRQHARPIHARYGGDDKPHHAGPQAARGRLDLG